MKNSIQCKLSMQILNLENAISNIDIQKRYLRQDLGYKSISKFVYDSRKKQLENAKNNLNETINFLSDMYRKAEGLNLNEFIGTKEIEQANQIIN